MRGFSSGFTLTELVVTIIIAGILAAVAIPRFVGVDSFTSRGFYDEATGVVRYAQKTAIARRQQVFVCVTPTSIAAAAATGCAIPLTHPTTGAALRSSAPDGISLSPAPLEFRFNGIGRPLDSAGVPSATITIAIASTIAGDPARQVVVETETGYVHP